MPSFANAHSDALDIALGRIENDLNQPNLESERLREINEALVFRSGQDSLYSDSSMRPDGRFQSSFYPASSLYVGSKHSAV